MAEKQLTIDITGFEQWAERFPAQVRAGAERGIQEAIMLLENAVKTNIMAGRPGGHGSASATGTLLGSVFSELRGTPATVRGVVAVSPPADRYALVVEEGRTPGARMPPAEALIPWIMKKMRDAVGGMRTTVTITSAEPALAGRRLKKRRRVISRDKLYDLAWRVARSIGKKGFPGVHMFGRAFTEHRQDVIQIVTERIKEAVGAASG
jgi:hypothetical protein